MLALEDTTCNKFVVSHPNLYFRHRCKFDLLRNDSRQCSGTASSNKISKMRSILLYTAVVLLIIHPCNSFGLDSVHNVLTHPYSPYVIGGLGISVSLPALCYIFYPAYVNDIEGSLSCTATVLAGDDKSCNQGEEIICNLPICYLFIYLQSTCTITQLKLTFTNFVVQKIYYHLLFQRTMRQNVYQLCSMQRWTI